MNSPSTYAEWCDLLNEIEHSHADSAFIDKIRHGRDFLSNTASKRFFRNVCDLVQRRVNNAQRAFQQQVDSAGSSSVIVSSAIKQLAKEYQYVYRIVQEMPIQKTNKASLLRAICDQADQTQARLKQIAVRGRNESLVSLIYRSPVNMISSQSAQESLGEDAE